MSEATVHRRLRSGSLRRKVAALRSVMVDAASGKLADAMTRAVDVLVKQLGHKNPDVAFRAAAKVLDSAVRVRAEVELAERVRELEDRLADAGDEG